MRMHELQSLKEERAVKYDAMRALSEKNAVRNLECGEEVQFDDLEKEVRSLDERIHRAEKMAEFDRFEARGEDVSGHEMRRELVNDFGLSKSVTEFVTTGKVTGREGEYQQEMRRQGHAPRGLMVPTEILLGTRERRAALTSGTGGNLVRTDLASMTDRRRPALKVEALGATVLQGLTGNLDLPRLSASGSAYWVSENTATTRSDATFEKKSLSPKTVSGEYELSRRMLLQSNEAIEPILRRDMGMGLATALDKAAIKGGGTNEPTGILADTAVTALDDETMGPYATADLIAALDLDDVTGTRAFFTHPANIKIARKIKDADGLPIPLATTFQGERVESSTQVPVATAASGSTAATYAMIYGEWASLYIGYWSGVDLLINPYADSVASKGGVLIHAFLDADVVVRHPEGFRWLEVTG